MVLKLTGGDRLGRLSKLPVRPGTDDGIALHAVVTKVSWLVSPKHEVGSNDDMSVDASATD